MKYYRPAIMGVIAVALLAGEVRCESQGDIIASYTLADTDGAVRILDKMDIGSKLKSGTYSAKANVRLKSEKRDTVSLSRNLEWARNAETSSQQLPEGWEINDGAYSWRNEKISQPIEIPLNIKPPRDTSLIGLDELRIDYFDLSSENPSSLFLKMILSGQKTGENAVVMGETEKPLKMVDALDVSSAVFERKDFEYSVKRDLGLPLDVNWRYIQDGLKTVLQKRFHKDFTSIEAVDLVFHPNVDIEKVGVNLRLGYRDYPKPSETVEGFAVPQKHLRMKGKKILRIEFGLLMSQPSYSGKKKVYLEEILIHLPGQAEQVIGGKMLEDMIFFTAADQGKDDKKIQASKESDLVLKLPAQTKTLSQGGKKQFSMDLRRLAGKMGGNPKIRSIALVVRPQRDNSPGGFRLLRAGMFSIVSPERSIFLAEGEDLNRRWGGPFLQLDDEKMVEWPGVAAYLPFQDLRRERRLIDLFPVVGKADSLSTGTKTSDSIQMNGVRVSAANPLTVTRSDHGLLMDVRGKWVDVYWPVEAPISKDTRFFLGIASETEALTKVEVSPVVNGRHMTPLPALPNQSVVLDIPETRIDGLNVRIIFPGDEPFRFMLKELVLFRPVAITPTQAVDFPLPVWREIPLTPAKVRSKPDMQVSIGRGYLDVSSGASGDLTWVTEVGRKTSWVQELRITHPASALPDKHSCWIRLTLIGSTHQTERTICPEKSADYTVISAEDLFHNTEISSEEILESIIWRVDVGNHGVVGQAPMRLAMDLSDVSVSSLRDRLTWHPFLEWKGEPLPPISLETTSADDILNGKAWVSLHGVSVGDTNNDSVFRFQEYPYFHAKTVIFEREQPLPKNMRALLSRERPHAPAGKRSPVNLRLISMFSVLTVLLLGFLWQKIRHETSKLTPWLTVAVGLYCVGIFMMYTQVGGGAESLFFGAGGIAMVFLWRGLSPVVRQQLEKHWPILAYKVYKGEGTYYIAGFLALIMVEVLLFTVNLQPVAEQFAIIGYYMLMLGVILEVRALRKGNGAREGASVPTG